MGQSSRKERLTDKDSSARGRDNPEERKPEGTEIPGGTGKGLEKEHSIPGAPARPRATRLLPPAGARHHGRSTLGWPKAEMATQKANTNSSTVDPLLALKTMVLQAEAAGPGNLRATLDQAVEPEGLSSTHPMPRAGHRRASQRCMDHRPHQRGHSSPTRRSQLARTLQEPNQTSAPALLLRGGQAPDGREQRQHAAMANHYQLQLVHGIFL